MSMIGNLLRISEEDLNLFLIDSSKLEDVIFDDEENPNLLDLDKTWDGLLYILTGYTIQQVEKTEPPLKWVIFGDYIIDEEQDLGYGPADYRTPAQVGEVNDAIKNITLDGFRTMFQNSELKMRRDIYPGILWPEGEEAFDYHFEYFERIQAFYSLAAQNNEAVISFIN